MVLVIGIDSTKIELIENKSISTISFIDRIEVSKRNPGRVTPF